MHDVESFTVDDLLNQWLLKDQSLEEKVSH